MEQHDIKKSPEILEPSDSCPLPNPGGSHVLRYKKTNAGKEIAGGTKLRILPVGDSITVGFLSHENGGDGDGYRRQLRDSLSSKLILTARILPISRRTKETLPENEVVYAGTETNGRGTMDGGYFVRYLHDTISIKFLTLGSPNNRPHGLEKRSSISPTTLSPRSNNAPMLFSWLPGQTI
jgi:hypothetical protein